MLRLETSRAPLASIHVDFYCHCEVFLSVGGEFKFICKSNRLLRAYFLTPSTADTAGKIKLHPAPTLIEVNDLNGTRRANIGAACTPHTLINIHLEFSSKALGQRRRLVWVGKCNPARF